MSQIKIATNVFFLRDGKVLLGLRKGGAGEGQWGLPGGHVEFGEKVIEAARRELMEELGIKNVELSFLHVVDNPLRKDGSHYIHVNFVAKGWEGEPENREPDKCGGLEWFPLDALPENIFYAHVPVWEAYRTGKISLF